MSEKQTNVSPKRIDTDLAPSHSKTALCAKHNKDYSKVLTDGA